MAFHLRLSCGRASRNTSIFEPHRRIRTRCWTSATPSAAHTRLRTRRSAPWSACHIFVATTDSCGVAGPGISAARRHRTVQSADGRAAPPNDGWCRWPSLRRRRHSLTLGGTPSLVHLQEMTASESRAARERLGLSVADLAVELNVTPAVVTAWESGAMAVPRIASVHLEYFCAVADREEAVREAGLPSCEWVAAWEARKPTSGVKALADHLEEILAHEKT